jgi:eukaryotic-like serine/threonine-protein kinase
VVAATLKMRGYLKAVAPDGRSAILEDASGTNATKTNIVSVPFEEGANPVPIAASRFDEYCSSVSPDGHWIAYQSDESSRPEVYVRDLGASGARWQVSTGGGEEPRWSRDGKELFYRDDTRLMVVPVETRGRFEAGAPRVVAEGIFNLRSDTGISYDVDPSGRRFLMIRPAVHRDRPVAVRVVLNWLEELRRRDPANSGKTTFR